MFVFWGDKNDVRARFLCEKPPSRLRRPRSNVIFVVLELNESGIGGGRDGKETLCAGERNVLDFDSRSSRSAPLSELGLRKDTTREPREDPMGRSRRSSRS